MSNVINTVTGEDDNLQLHVQLCEQRYQQLLVKFDEVDDRLDVIERMLTEIKDTVIRHKNNTYKTYLGWSGAVITVLLGAVVTLLIT